MPAESLDGWLDVRGDPAQFHRRVHTLAERFRAALAPGPSPLNRGITKHFLQSFCGALSPSLRHAIRDPENPIVIARLPLRLQGRLAHHLYSLWATEMRLAAKTPLHIVHFDRVLIQADPPPMVFWKLGKRGREWGSAYRMAKWRPHPTPPDTGVALSLAGRRGTAVEEMAADLANLLPPPASPRAARRSQPVSRANRRGRLAPALSAFVRALPKAARERMAAGEYVAVRDLPKRAQDLVCHAFHIQWAERLLGVTAKPVFLRDLLGCLVFMRAPGRKSSGCFAIVHPVGLGGFFMGDPPRRRPSFCWPPRKYLHAAATAGSRPTTHDVPTHGTTTSRP